MIEEVLIGAAAELLPELMKALFAGKRREARDLSEEIARRQTFELAQRAKSAAIKKAKGGR